MEDLIIRVPEAAHKGFLDRDTVVAAIRKDLKPWCDLIEDITSYGSNLIPRCFVSSGRQLKDAVVLATLLRQVVAMLDGIHILLCNGACHVAQLPARALFESSLYIDWILLKDSETKSLYYYVHNLRRKRLWNRRVQSGTAAGKKFMPIMERSGVHVDADVVLRSKKHLEEIEKVLSTKQFAPVGAIFDKLLKERRREPAWYAPLGPHNLRGIAEAVSRLPEYLVFYSTLSQAIHASSYEQHIAIGRGELTFQPIRTLEGFDAVLRIALNNALATYRRVLQEYRAGELRAFSRKYMEKWQKNFLNVPHINVRVDPITI